MTNKEKVEQDIEIVKAAIDQLKEDVEFLADEERADLKNRINAALGEYADEVEKIKELDRTLTEKLGKYGKRFLYASVCILTIIGIDRLISYIKDLF